MGELRIQWRKVFSSEKVRRSSHIIAVKQPAQPLSVAVFGGELKSREPVDSKLYEVDLNDDAKLVVSTHSEAPSPRVGSAAATLNECTYLFSGRSGQSMSPIDEQGCVWELSHQSGQWTLLEPANPDSPFPPPRSYHALTSDKRHTLYLHAGCQEKGRLSDLWAFQLSTRRWIKLADAPDPPRGGTSIVFCAENERLYRMNGFDGMAEQGGSLDVYNPETDCWSSIAFTADGKDGPEPRSVASLLCMGVGNEAWLVTMFGERDPSSLGHAGAGKMLDDVWAWNINSEAWTKVEVIGPNKPQSRGWLAADLLSDDMLIVQGGLNEANERLGDLWIGRLRAKE